MTNKTLLAIMFVLLLSTGPLLAGGDAANGQALSEDCAMCHGEDGMGDGGDMPAIAGMDEASHVTALMDYASGARADESEMMADYAAALSEQDMADLATYYASLK